MSQQSILTPEQALQLEQLIRQAERLHRLSVVRRAAERLRPRNNILELTPRQIDRLLTRRATKCPSNKER